MMLRRALRLFNTLITRLRWVLIHLVFQEAIQYVLHVRVRPIELHGTFYLVHSLLHHPVLDLLRWTPGHILRKLPKLTAA